MTVCLRSKLVRLGSRMMKRASSGYDIPSHVQRKSRALSCVGRLLKNFSLLDKGVCWAPISCRLVSCVSRCSRSSLGPLQRSNPKLTRELHLTTARPSPFHTCSALDGPLMGRNLRLRCCRLEPWWRNHMASCCMHSLLLKSSFKEVKVGRERWYQERQTRGMMPNLWRWSSCCQARRSRASDSWLGRRLKIGASSAMPAVYVYRASDHGASLTATATLQLEVL